MFNLRPTLAMPLANQGLDAPATTYLPSANSVTVSIVAAVTSTAGAARVGVHSNGAQWLWGPYNSFTVGSRWFMNGFKETSAGNPPLSTTTLETHVVQQSAAGNSMWRNGASLTPVAAGQIAPLRLSVGGGAGNFSGTSLLGVVSELIEWNAVVSPADLALLQANQKAYYGTP